MTNELRKDYLIDRWVVIASVRRKRPTDFIRKRETRRVHSCPFCPGNEHLTPPAVLVYIPSKGGILKKVDGDGYRHKDWIVRCVPNLYPAFNPPNKDEGLAFKGMFKVTRATGHHEVIIESPRHEEHPGSANIKQLIHVINAYIDRYVWLASKPYVKYVSIFRNYGADAGASLSHAHTQIITTPFIPRIVDLELSSCRTFWNQEGKCIFCKIIEDEQRSSRFIWENKSFIVFSPWASIHPFEFWLFPKKHQTVISELNEIEIKDLAEALRICLGGLRSLLNDPSYNLGFHMVPEKYYHWHVEVYPRLSIWAGFEKSTGMYINVMPPEDAAKMLRESILDEAEAIKT